RCAGHHRHQEGALGVLTTFVADPARRPPLQRRVGAGGGGRGSHNQRAATAAISAARTAPPPRAACRGAGIGTLSRSGTLWVNRRISHPLALAARRSSASGLTTTGWPTASSIGRSVAESL